MRGRLMSPRNSGVDLRFAFDSRALFPLKRLVRYYNAKKNVFQILFMKTFFPCIAIESSRYKLGGI